MENASKALLISGGILLAILIISLATRIFSSASRVSDSYHSQESASDIAMFNSNFTKFIGAVHNEDDVEVQTFATIHDIISLANFAWDYNTKIARKLEVDPILPANQQGNGFIHINLKITKPTEKKITNIENYKDNIYQELIKKGYYKNRDKPDQDNIITYKIDIEKYSEVGKIIEVTFSPYYELDGGSINDVIIDIQNKTDKEKKWEN